MDVCALSPIVVAAATTMDEALGSPIPNPAVARLSVVPYWVPATICTDWHPHRRAVMRTIGCSSGSLEDRRRCGYHPSIRAFQDYGTGALEKFQTRNAGPPPRLRSGVPIQAPCKGFARLPRPRFSQSPEGNFCSRLFLAPTQKLHSGPNAEIPSGVLGAEIGSKQGKGY
jgi:hypothetical protein